MGMIKPWVSQILLSLIVVKQLWNDAPVTVLTGKIPEITDALYNYFSTINGWNFLNLKNKDYETPASSKSPY